MKETIPVSTFNTTLAQLRNLCHQGCVDAQKAGLTEKDCTHGLINFLQNAPEQITVEKPGKDTPLQIGVTPEKKLIVSAKIQTGVNRLTKKPILAWKTWQFTGEELEALQ